MNGNRGHVDRDVKELSYREYIKARYANVVVLARQMEKTIGKDRAHEIIKDTFYNDIALKAQNAAENNDQKELHQFMREFPAFAIAERI